MGTIIKKILSEGAVATGDTSIATQASVPPVAEMTKIEIFRNGKVHFKSASKFKQ